MDRLIEDSFVGFGTLAGGTTLCDHTRMETT
jgi:hypothetical protein